MNKKAQAAMEFLLTYGWAILVVLLVIASLVYFGVLSPRQFLPTKCTLDSPLYCVDKQVTEAGVVKILIRNGNPNAITIDSFAVEDLEALVQCGNQTAVGTGAIVASGETAELSLSECTISASKGKKVKLSLDVGYTDRLTKFDHSAAGEMLVAIE